MSFAISQQRDIDAEIAVLGSVLLKHDIMDEISPILKHTDFTSIKHELIWKAMTYLYQKNQPIDIVTVSSVLNQYNRIEEIGGVEYLSKLAESVPTTRNAKFYAGIVHSKSLRRKGLDLAEQIKHLAMEQEHENDEEFLNEVEKHAFALRPKINGDMRHISETREGYIEYLRTKDQFIYTGFQNFDQWMGGLGRGWLYILAGRPSVGKTAKALQMALGIANQNVGEVVIFSQEMKREQLINRIISPMTGIHANRIRRKQLDELEFQKVEQAYNKLELLPLHIEDVSGVSIEHVRASARRIKRKHGCLAAIIVDYLTIMNIQQLKGQTRAQSVGEVTRKAKQIALELDCPFIMLAQMSREGARAEEPRLDHLRDSGEIEQDADVVEFLWEDPNETRDAGIVVQSTIAKGRDVGVNKFKYLFKGWIQRFDEL